MFRDCKCVALGFKLIQHCVESGSSMEGRVKVFERSELELLLDEYLVNKKCLLVALECCESIDSTYSIRQNVLLNMYSIPMKHTSHDNVSSQQPESMERNVWQSNPVCTVDLGVFLFNHYSNPQLSSVSISVSMLTSFMLLITSNPNGTNVVIYIIRIG
jgi:hypothetical protein